METTAASPLERALGQQVQFEAKRQGLSHKEIQARAGINDKSFRRWFVEGARHIPLSAILATAEALGVPASELMARAEAEVATGPNVRAVKPQRIDEPTT